MILREFYRQVLRGNSSMRQLIMSARDKASDEYVDNDLHDKLHLQIASSLVYVT